MGPAPSFLSFILLTAVPADAAKPTPEDPAFKRFAERFLKLVREPSPERFNAVAAMPRIRESAKSFVSRYSPDERRDDVDLVEEWLTTLDPLCDDAWIGASIVKSISTKDGVERVRLRLKADDGLQIDCLVWLVDEAGEKQLIDLQRLPSGMNAAVVTHFALVDGWGETLANEFREMEEDLGADPRLALHKLKEVSKGKPRQYRDRIYLAWAADGLRPKTALRYSSALNRAFEDDPAVPWFTAKSHYELEQFRDVARCLEWYESIVGADSWSRLLRAKVHRKEGRFAEARRELAAALKDDPVSEEAVLELFETTPPQSKADAANLLPTDSTFDPLGWTLGSTFGQAGDAQSLQAVLKHAEKAQAPPDLIAYLRGQTLLSQGKLKEAADAVAGVLPERDDGPDEADAALDLYCDAMHRLKRAEDAYRVSRTPAKTLFALLEKMIGLEDAPLGERLGREHLKRFPQDGEAVAVVARILVEGRKLKEAASVVDAFLRRPEMKDALETDDLRRLRAKIFIREKDPAGLVRFVGEDEDLFETAAAELAASGRVPELEKLIDGFKAPAGDPISFMNWKAELAFLKKDYGLAFAYFQTLVQPPAVDLDDRRRILFLRLMLRMNYKAGFEQVAENLLAPNAELGFALAYAVSGNRTKLEIALEECLEAGLTEEQILNDPDLGPLLAAPSLAKIRDKVLLDRDLAP